jgi:hypothetical protein
MIRLGEEAEEAERRGHGGGRAAVAHGHGRRERAVALASGHCPARACVPWAGSASGRSYYWRPALATGYWWWRRSVGGELLGYGDGNGLRARGHSPRCWDIVSSAREGWLVVVVRLKPRDLARFAPEIRNHFGHRGRCRSKRRERDVYIIHTACQHTTLFIYLYTHRRTNTSSTIAYE